MYMCDYFKLEIYLEMHTRVLREFCRINLRRGKELDVKKVLSHTHFKYLSKDRLNLTKKILKASLNFISEAAHNSS